MHTSLRDFLSFTKNQRRAIFLLSVLLIALVVAKEYLLVDDPMTPKETQQLDELLAQVEGVSKRNRAIDKYSPSDIKENLISDVGGEEIRKKFKFDPNEIQLKEWQELGLSRKQAEVILRYRNKGGSFRVKKDLAKMYVISESFYSELEDFIMLPDTIEWKQPNKYSSFEKEPDNFIIDLNKADSLELLSLKGIGPFFASRIIKFRNALGGFYATDQLHEVWGLEDSLVENIKPRVQLSSDSLKKIYLNRATVEELSAHPYLSWKVARSIVNFRSQHGAFKNEKSLDQLYLIDDSLKARLSPYLDFTLK